MDISKTLLLTILLSIAATSHGQRKERMIGRLLYPGCERAEDKDECMREKFAQFYIDNLDKSYFKPQDTVDGRIYSYIRGYYNFTTTGEYDWEVSSGRTELNDSIINDINRKLPRMMMPIDAKGYRVAQDYRNLLRYELIYENDALEKVKYSPVKEKDFIVYEGPNKALEKWPVYPGCNPADSPGSLRDCLSEQLSILVKENFNIDVVDSENSKEGTVRILLIFTINKRGIIDRIDASAKYPELEKEAQRCLRLAKKMVRPAIRDGKPVNLSLTIPLLVSI